MIRCLLAHGSLFWKEEESLIEEFNAPTRATSHVGNTLAPSSSNVKITHNPRQCVRAPLHRTIPRVKIHKSSRVVRMIFINVASKKCPLVSEITTHEERNVRKNTIASSCSTSTSIRLLFFSSKSSLATSPSNADRVQPLRGLGLEREPKDRGWL